MTSCGAIDVADRLRHLAALDVDEEPVRQDFTIRRVSTRAEPDEQRALEPSAVLVAALEVHVGRPAELGSHATARPRGCDPESNQTSRMFISRSKLVPPQAGQASPGGTKSSVGRLYQASAP